jgi:hypothetical protein
MEPSGLVTESPTITVIKDWPDFNRFAQRFVSLGGATKHSYFFRGQSHEEWSLSPSLARLLRGATSVEHALEIESIAQERFAEQAHLFLPPSLIPDRHSFLGWWSLMQHYKAPTRLLDWTASIFVAAYFAVVEAWDASGAVWVYHPHTVREYMLKLYGGDIAKAGFAKLDRLLRSLSAPPQLFHFEARLKSDRIVAQQGATTVCGQILYDHALSISSAIPRDTDKLLFHKIVIPAPLKPTFLLHLRSMNITANSLFPGLDGLGQSITELVQTEIAKV